MKTQSAVDEWRMLSAAEMADAIAALHAAIRKAKDDGKIADVAIRIHKTRVQ